MAIDIHKLVLQERASAAGKVGGRRAMVTMTPEERRERARAASNAHWERVRAEKAAAAAAGAVATEAQAGSAAVTEQAAAAHRRATPHQLRAALAITCAALERIAAGRDGASEQGDADPRELARAALSEERVRAARERATAVLTAFHARDDG